MKITLSLTHIVGLLLLNALLFWGSSYFSKTDAIITTIAPGIKTIQVPVDTLTPKVITEYVKVEDRAVVNKLLKENESLKIRVQQLTIGTGTSTSHVPQGAGTTTVVTKSESPSSTPAEPQTIFYDDKWRLKFWTDGKNSEYWLKQKFVVTTSSGFDEKKIPVSITKLYEVGREGERIEIPMEDITTIATMNNRMRWYLRPSFQAGFVAHPKQTTTVLNNQATKALTATANGIIAVPFIKRGTDTVPERTKLSILTPALSISSNGVSVGVLPGSLNIGHSKHMPFSDLWISPYIGIVKDNSKNNQFGIAVTATF